MVKPLKDYEEQLRSFVIKYKDTYGIMPTMLWVSQDNIWLRNYCYPNTVWGLVVAADPEYPSDYISLYHPSLEDKQRVWGEIHFPHGTVEEAVELFVEYVTEPDYGSPEATIEWKLPCGYNVIHTIHHEFPHRIRIATEYYGGPGSAISTNVESFIPERYLGMYSQGSLSVKLLRQYDPNWDREIEILPTTAAQLAELLK